MMMPTLETPRLILRPFLPEDWHAINHMLADPENTRYMHFRNWSEARRREWLNFCVENAKQSEPGSFEWAIARKQTGTVIGWFGIGAASNPEVENDISFGYVLDQAYWNQGYMTETLHAVQTWEFETLGAPQLTATCEVANGASARVMEKTGMIRRTTETGADFEGNRAHRHHYIITRSEYFARQSSGCSARCSPCQYIACPGSTAAWQSGTRDDSVMTWFV